MKKILTLILVAILTLSMMSFAIAEEKPYKIGMLPQFIGENYFDGCRVGAEMAAKELGIEFVYDGPNQSEATNAKQVEILTGWMAAGDFDAFIVSPCDSEGILPTLYAAKEAGIAVITFDSDTPDYNSRAFFVNQAPSDAIAKAMVDVVVADLQEKGFGENQTARLALISSTGLDQNANAWALSVKNYVEGNFPWLTLNTDESGYLGPDIWTPGSDESAAQTAANEVIALSGNATDGSQINAAIGLSSMATPALAAAWNATVGAKPVVSMTGLATPMALVDYILDEENPMEAGVLWNVNDLGYLSVEATVAYLDGVIDPVAGNTFESKLGTKEFAVGVFGGIDLLLGDALTFDIETVEDYNY